MPQVNVSIGGRAYRLACNPGEEAHLESLARGVDAKITDMRASFGEIGDQRLTVMAALTLADELAEAKRIASARGIAADEAREAARVARDEGAAAARALEEMCERVETLAASLSGG
jgi:cell division protein ZapA